MPRPRKPGRRVDKTGRSIGEDRYLKLEHWVLKSAAWRSLSPVERALLIEVAQRYNGRNNGQIGLGIREAGKAINVKHTTAGKAFLALQERGFLELMQDSGFDQKRLAREWRVTFFPMGDARAPTSPATKEFMRWQPGEEKRNAGPKGDPHRAALGPYDPKGNKQQSPERALSSEIGETHRPHSGLTSTSHGGDS